MVPSVISELGCQVEILEDHFKGETPDDLWLQEAGRRGWFVITLDGRILYTEESRKAISDFKVGLFLIPVKKPNKEVLSETLRACWPKLLRFISKTRRPFIAKLYRGGSVVSWTAETD